MADVKTTSRASTASDREALDHRLIAGNLSLDFVNTLNGHGRARGHEYLHDFRDLVMWSRHAGLLPSSEATRALRESSLHPFAAEREFRETIRLREILFRLFACSARGRRADMADLRSVESVWREGQRHLQLVSSGRSYLLGWDDHPILESISRSLCSSAITLLTSPDIERIRMCSGEACDWLFLDTSRNHLRRWCSMDECGNRAKMRRRRLRLKAGQRS
jgi:predicted RNA-binding Zn ribbon-like protein